MGKLSFIKYPPSRVGREGETVRNVFEYYGKEDHLAHYGILGMKWGVRRYQNPDGSLTAAGRERYGESGMTAKDKREARKEVIADNKKAYEYGREATISANTASYAKRAEEKAQKRFDKKPTDKNAEKLQIVKKISEDWSNKANADLEKVKNHREELLKKYGDESVSELKFDKAGQLSERIHDTKDFAMALGMTIGMTGALQALGLPIAYIEVPSGKLHEAAMNYLDSYTAEKQARKDHKYLEKIGEGKDARYFYTQEELDAYKKSGFNSGSKESSSSGRSASEKQASLKRARDNDLYEINFLEAVQNSKILHDGDTKALLKEYDAYLDDPDAYWERGRKLDSL